MLSAFLLNRSELRFAGVSFTVKVILFWLAELVICQLDGGRGICRVVARGFVPCLVSFAVMDLLVVTRLRRRVARRKNRDSQHIL